MESPALAPFHPLIREWFAQRLGMPTEIQALAWPRILAGRHVLVTAPTGSGKTLTAFLVALHHLLSGTFAPGRLQVLYLSPLKALGNDIQRNLLGPLAELTALATDRGQAVPIPRVLTRTGDTPNEARRAMLRHPPEILVTTPESLGLMLTSPRSRALFADLRVVILDEIHALAGGKRGTYTMAQVERLTLFGRDVQRIGLSATVHPAARVAQWMGGFESDRLAAGAHYHPRAVEVVASTDRRPPAITVRLPEPPAAGPEAKDQFWEALAADLRARIHRNRATLIFANSRRTVEKLVRLVNDGATPPLAYSHHGSLSRELRFDVEERMKAGELRAIVATGSLELGIDIGSIDEVVLVGAPPSLAQTLQRLGRADHRVGGQSRGQIIALHGLDGLESATLVGLCGQGLLEETTPPTAPLDVLAQVLLSLGCGEPWDLEALYAFVRRIAAYHDLARDRFDELLAMLGGRFADRPLRDLRARATVDPVAHTFSSRKGTDFVLYQSGGTIPDRGYFHLRLADSKAMLGELDEEFVWERRLGDQFTLGTQAWRILRITHNDVEVGPADPGKPMIPFWKAEAQNRSTLASFALLDLLDTCRARLRDPAFPDELARTHALPVPDAQRLLDFLARQAEACGGRLPGRHDVILECLSGTEAPQATQQVVLHTFWGGKVNRPLAMALAELGERRHGVPLETFATNDQILLLLPDGVDPARLLPDLDPESVTELLRARLQKTPLFGARFRENAARALLLPRGDARRRYPLWLRRLRAKKLLATVEALPDFPIVLETWRELIEDDFDLPTLRRVLGELAAGRLRAHVVRPPKPSPFCDGVIFQQTNYHMYLDDSPGPGMGQPPSASRLRELFGDVAPLPPELAAAFARKLRRQEPGYEPGSAEDLAFAIREQGFPPRAVVEAWLAPLDPEGDRSPLANLVTFTFQGATVPLVCDIGDLPRLLALRPAAAAPVPFLPGSKLGIPAFLADHPGDEADDPSPLLGEFLAFRGPTTAAEITAHLGFPADALTALLDDLGDAVVPCPVAGDPTPHFCDAENADRLARLHRAHRRGRATRDPVPLATLPAFLAAWQKLGAPGQGLSDLQAALEPLFGYPLPAETWEEAILPARLSPYHPSWLDSLFQSFDLTWLGTGKDRLTLALADDRELFLSPTEDAEPPPTSPILAALRADPRGRTLADLCLEGDRPAVQAVAELWRLAGEGQVTSSSFEPVRRRILGRFKDEVPRPAPGGRRRGFARRSPTEGIFQAVPPPTAGTPLDQALLEADRCRLLFTRYGVLFRELLERELPPLRWPRLLRALRLLELSGEIVAGHFFDGIPGLQFATPPALARLAEPAPATLVAMNACDPASPCGLGLPAFSAFPKRLPSNTVVLKGAELRLVLSRGGRDLRAHLPPDHPELPAALRVFRTFLERQFHPEPAIAVETINGERALTSPYAPRLREFGFRPDYLTLTLSR